MSSFHVRGAIADLHQMWASGEFPDELLVDGPAGTGKSMGIAWFLDMIQSTHPGAQGLVLRKTRRSLTRSWMRTFRKTMDILYPGGDRDHLFAGRTDATRDEYAYHNGSIITVGGMDDPTRHFSTEYDWVYVNEGQELLEEEWESMHRALREGKTPHQFLLADVNPAAEGHWFNRRCQGSYRHDWEGYDYGQENGLCKRLKSRHVDNPWLTDDPDGSKYLAKLKRNLTGVRYERLFLGRWVSSEGAVYPQFRESTHVIDGYLKKDGRAWYLHVTSGLGCNSVEGDEKAIELTWFFAAVDFGWTVPSVLGIWGVDREGRMYLVEEHYHTGWTHAELASKAAEANKKFNLNKIIVDNAEPALISVFNNYLSWKDRSDDEPIAQGCEKTLANGRTNIDLTRDRLVATDDGWPRIFFLRDARQHDPDPVLIDRKCPTTTWEEWSSYIYKPATSPDPELQKVQMGREEVMKRDDHGIDMTHYAVRYAHGRNMTPPEPAEQWSSPNSAGARMGLDPKFFGRKRYGR